MGKGGKLPGGEGDEVFCSVVFECVPPVWLISGKEKGTGRWLGPTGHTIAQLF